MNTDNDPFDPTPNLKSSPVPVLFIPFKNNEEKCNYCGIKYSKSLKYDQKYCKDCLFWYIQYITGNNKYLDLRINTNNSQCIKHKATRNYFYITNIQEWCEYCSEILYFIQVVVKNSNCKHNGCCKDCYYKMQLPGYQISSGWVDSTLTKKSIPILYLPWWDSHNQCVNCNKELKYTHQESKTYCQKWCSRCFIIYTGCRYCLTTNIIFGIADQSQCKKCKRILFIRIDITDTIRSGNCIIDEFLDSTKSDNKNFHIITNYMYMSKTIRSPFEVYLFIQGMSGRGIGWIPYSQITNLKKIAEGGFSIIYKATWEGTDVAVKKLHDSQNIKDTPEWYAELMKKCWDSNPSKRPTIDKIYISISIWYNFGHAEKKRLELIQLKKLGPEFSEKSHPKAIYTSRALSDLISKASTIGSMVSFNMKQEYITQEYEFDIDNIQRSSIQNTNSATQSLIVPVNSLRKRNFEELKNETNENQKNRKYTKVDNSNDELLNIIELI
ncbi:unnamed protein product [Rhizophagus irregularis]|nr:unnamed protein product [Rhizophagus irregularis]